MKRMNSSRQILAENIKSILDRDGLSVRGFAMRHKLPQKQIDRIVKKENAVSLDTLDELADAIGVMSWQLLVVGLNTSEPPKIAVTETELMLYQKLSNLMKS